MNKPPIYAIFSSRFKRMLHFVIFFAVLFQPAIITQSLAQTSSEISIDSLKESQLYIQSDTMQYDDQKLISIYEGNVIAKQIARELLGDKMIVSYTADKSVKEIEVFGNPAQYFQYKTETQEELRARAQYIKYMKQTETLELQKNVYLDKADFKSSSENLIYKINTGEVRAESSTKTRVEMILN